MAGKTVSDAHVGCRRRWLRLCGLARTRRRPRALSPSHGEPFSAGRADPPGERSEARAVAKPKLAGAAEAAAARARAALAAQETGREAGPAAAAAGSDRATICIAGC
jgi:hypothetical protein